MHPRPSSSFAALVVFLISAPGVAHSQAVDSSRHVRVFIDCSSQACDLDYFRREIQFVDHMRDRQDASVHVLVTSQPSSTVSNVVTIEDGALTALAGQTKNVTFNLPSAISYGDLHVGFGAGDSGSEGPLTFGGLDVTPSNYFSGSDGAFWDDRSIPLKGFFGSPTADSTITSGTDCLTWAYASLTRRAS